MTGTSKTINLNFSVFSVNSVAFINFSFSVAKYLVIIRVNSWIKYNLFEKTKPIFPRFWPKNGYLPKFKANSNPIKPNFIPAKLQRRRILGLY